MPNGKTHDKINVFFFIILVIGSCFFGVKMTVFTLFFTIGYFFGTYFLSPDLDTKSRPYYRWGYFRFLWTPYRRFFSHRSIWTHGILIGDIVRLMYMSIYIVSITGCFFLFFPSLFPSFFHYFTAFLSQNKEEIINAFIGISLASFMHIMSDRSVSYLKKRKQIKK